MPLLPLWVFVACSRVTFTFTLMMMMMMMMLIIIIIIKEKLFLCVIKHTPMKADLGCRLKLMVRFAS